ncbi:MAG TPA: hypothetical protein VJN21_09705 [Candidatus Acidoferrales bacterium]|nr:hypothetical protein [Candidatus Acidoferrales bacterium]
MRRSLVNRLGIFLLGAIAFFVPCFMYPPLELDSILIFIGVLFFGTIALAIAAERRAIRHQEVEALKRIFFGLVPLPWILGMILLVNGSFDRSAPRDYDTRVVSRFSMPGIMPMHQLVVTSWRDGHRVERIMVSGQDFDSFRDSESVDVRVSEGLVIPWVEGVYHP